MQKNPVIVIKNVAKSSFCFRRSSVVLFEKLAFARTNYFVMLGCMQYLVGILMSSFGVPSLASKGLDKFQPVNKIQMTRARDPAFPTLAKLRGTVLREVYQIVSSPKLFVLLHRV